MIINGTFNSTSGCHFQLKIAIQSEESSKPVISPEKFYPTKLLVIQFQPFTLQLSVLLN